MDEQKKGKAVRTYYSNLVGNWLDAFMYCGKPVLEWVGEGTQEHFENGAQLDARLVQLQATEANS